jgi:hypothetical protein
MTPDLRRLRCRLSAVLVLGLGLGVWLYHGGRLGFWVTSVEKRVEEPVIPGMPELGMMESVVREERFLCGIETLVAALALALLLWGISFLFSDKNENSKEST